MISKIKENNTLYIRRCNHCKSMFSYNAQDYASNYGYGNEYGLIRCPYCEHKNKIKFKIRYKSSKKVNQDYKVELEKVKNNNISLKNDIEKLQKEYKDFKYEVGECESYKAMYKDSKVRYDKLHADYNNKTFKLNGVQDYINDYMNSSKKNNLATKYLKEIQEIIK